MRTDIGWGPQDDAKKVILFMVFFRSKKMIICFVGVILSLTSAYAQRGGDNQPRGGGGGGSLNNPEPTPHANELFRYLMTQPEGQTARPLPIGNLSVLELLKIVTEESAASLNRPSPPLTWMENYRTTTYSSNTAVGLRSTYASPIWTNFKASIEFKYSVKTNFVMIGAAKRNAANGSTSHEEEYTTTGVDKRSYPLADSKNPMVGYCVFEIAFSIDKGNSNVTEATLPLFNQIFPYMNQTTALSSIRGFSHARLSPVFQIRDDIAIDDYVDQVCGRYFKERHMKAVIGQATNRVMSLMWHYNPKSQCRPPEPKDQGQPEGDDSCLEWHNRRKSVASDSMNIPRCEFMHDGAHKCVLKARREGIQCPMFYNSQTDEISAARTPGDQKATGGSQEYMCDTHLGLSCQMVSEPTIAFNRVLFAGEARCKKTQ